MQPRQSVLALQFLLLPAMCQAAEIRVNNQPAQLDIRQAGEHSVRVTLKPENFKPEFPFTPALVDREYTAPAISLREISQPVKAQVGTLNIEVLARPLTIVVTTADGQTIQRVVFEDDGNLSFAIGDQPVLGLGEGGPLPRGNFRTLPVEYDRRGRLEDMRPRWQSDTYGSRNPVALLIGTDGWGLFIATPWGQVDLRDSNRGVFTPWQPPVQSRARGDSGKDEPRRGRSGRANLTAQLQGRPPVASIVPGLYDLFIFDARDPTRLMKDLSIISGPAVIPPKWSLGYMQSHRELVDKELSSEALLLSVVDTFREKRIPLDAVIYLGTGFTPTGWNTRQPSFTFNPRVFERPAKDVLADLHARHVKVIVHIVPWQRDRLPTLQGSIPAQPGETRDASHIESYWNQHVDLVKTGVDAWWPDEGDWFNLFERIKRHQLYYQGPLSTQPHVRPWSLHRNGHLGVAQWGGWVWSGDTQSTWKTLEAQVAVGINHSLSLSPYWGSDTGGFYTTSELTGELYARWFQFSAFCPSFRSHGRIWRLRTPWGWGLSDMGFVEGQKDLPKQSEMNNPAIEPICKKYAELRYRLMPYTYTLAAEARESGMPLMRAMWLHYPKDEKLRGNGTQYLWGRDILVAPVFKPQATSWEIYLPEGDWYDWWSNEKVTGPKSITRKINLETMPVYVRAGAIIPFDPVRQYTSEPVTEPTTIRVYSGANGQFRWYEDDGQSQEYLQGKFAWTTLRWDDANRRLVIEREMTAGTLETSRRDLVVTVLPEGASQTISYDGQRTEVNF
ncbi:MAG TPA: TIM-barrel domain-containing protein [Pirellulales bacterium]|nr:TIM-barrel domain-containing protein [Pirellulales bacterium]